jgi:molecular chaperone GrpE (heat shock protein)
MIPNYENFLNEIAYTDPGTGEKEQQNGSSGESTENQQSGTTPVDPKAQEPEVKDQEPKAQEPKAQEPKVQEPKVQEPKAATNQNTLDIKTKITTHITNIFKNFKTILTRKAEKAKTSTVTPTTPATPQKTT